MQTLGLLGPLGGILFWKPVFSPASKTQLFNQGITHRWREANPLLH
jgi:hypothetical protein